jgi:hypothetical protein
VDSFFFLSKSLNISRSFQAVSDPADGFDLGPDLAQFLAETFYVGVYRSGFEGAGVVPNSFEELLAATNQSSVANQVQQELELQGRERDRLAIDGDLVPRHVDAEAFDLEPVEGLVRLSLGAPHHSAQAKRQLSRAERLGHEIIRTELKGNDSIDLVIAARNEDHRLGSGLRVLAYPPEDLGGPHVRELVFDDEPADLLPRQKPDRALAVPGCFEVRPARSQGLSQRRKQGAITSNDATIYRHHCQELADRA